MFLIIVLFLVAGGVVFVVIVVDPRNVPLNFGWNLVINSWDIEFLFGVVDGMLCRIIFMSTPTELYVMLSWDFDNK